MELHGGNIHKLKRERGIEVLDYSANINPLGISKKLKEKICEKLDLLEKYPDPEYYEMKEVIAIHNKVEIKNIIVGNGATEIMFLYAKNIKPKKVLIISPTFAEYERAIKSGNSNCHINYFELREDEDFILNIPQLKKELEKKYDLLIICNPNNPTGKFIDKVILDDLAIFCKNKSINILLDEAFIEFVEGSLAESLVEFKHKNVFIVRALTKFFAIPGLRLGYGITYDMELKDKIESTREPWSVNGIAELATKVLLEDKDYIKESENWIKEEKNFMYKKLEKISGIKPYKTETNFILVKLTTGIKVKEFRKKMISLGVLIRDASNFNYLDDNYFRLAIKDRKNNIKVLRCVEDAIR